MIQVNETAAAFMRANEVSPVKMKLRRIGGDRFVLADGSTHKLTFEEQRMLPTGYPKWVGKPAADQLATSPDDWRQPYRSRDASGNDAAAGRVAWNWIEDLGKRLHEQGRDAMIETGRASADGFTIQLWEGTSLLALATVFRDPMNFSVLVRWAADGVVGDAAVHEIAVEEMRAACIAAVEGKQTYEASDFPVCDSIIRAIKAIPAAGQKGGAE
ncbi:hypothetical protein GRI97_08275 [Altererythrobacter xixiisoli]|uniref:Uncharacterized protein n=1 Tax=Croceibacterium xixiisoli TaxID=1476466 RepID=A0A6I4TXC8_9SPHN|nr:hypothetical protein [Croceibacterium xixiisoli]MXO98983.1 hypothetical protein [Croceibacterium xixiisoli]